MRQRITFIHEPQDAIDPKTFQILKDTKHGPSLTLKGLKAAREDKITFNYDELPEEVQEIFERTNEAHIKYVQPGLGKTLAPLDARVANGLHVWFEDRYGGGITGMELSRWLIEEFNMNSHNACGDMNSYSFVTKPADCKYNGLKKGEGKQSAYYVSASQLPSSENFIAPHDRNIWGNLLGDASSLTRGWSKDRLDEMDSATSIDIDFTYDAQMAPILTMTTYWSPREWASTTIEALIPRSSTNERIEIGVLSNETPERPEEVKLAGYLTLLGSDTAPKATMFSFPSKHHHQAALYNTSWIQPTGLHPNLALQITNSIPPPSGEECRLYAHLTLPPAVFADRFQFTDALFLVSKNLSGLSWTSTPVDLEAPEYAEAAKVSSLLLELAPPAPRNESWTAEIPLHLRYLKPSKSGYAEVQIPTPMLFWGCEADDMDGRNPFARQGMVIEKLLPEKNVFYHLGFAEGETGYKALDVPVLSTQYERYIELGTSVVILLGFGWVMWKALQVLRSAGYGSGSPKEKLAAKKE